jgi:excisionase family DNA binding protein
MSSGRVEVDIEPLLVSPATTCRLIDVSMATLYEMIKGPNPVLPSVKFGRNRRIKMSAIKQFIADREAAE